jgi:hypothetical protein
MRSEGEQSDIQGRAIRGETHYTVTGLCGFATANSGDD